MNKNAIPMRCRFLLNNQSCIACRSVCLFISAFAVPTSNYVWESVISDFSCLQAVFSLLTGRLEVLDYVGFFCFLGTIPQCVRYVYREVVAVSIT